MTKSPAGQTKSLLLSIIIWYSCSFQPCSCAGHLDGINYQVQHDIYNNRNQPQYKYRQRHISNNRPPPRGQQYPSSYTMTHYADTGFSPNLNFLYSESIDDIKNAEGGSSLNYFERNGIRPPPIISRRRAQSNETAAESDGNGTATITSDNDLELIVEEAKLGRDPSTRLRTDLMHWNNNGEGYYDKHAFPWEYAWVSQYNNTDNVSDVGDRRLGLPIEIGINFHRVFSVDVINPVLDMVVWFRLQWVDPRLTWDPLEYGNLTKTWFFIQDGGAGGETSEIWTPDIELWNLEEGLKSSLDDAYAIVSYDGSVFWSRPGHLRPTCKFIGMEKFPFDKLTCAMEFGSWVYSGKYLRLVKTGGETCYSIGGSQTAGESFNEFSFAKEDPISCKTHVYPPYPASPDEDWPVMLYNVTIERSWQPYARGYMVTQVMLNIIGFSAFWLPPPCGERMGLSISSILSAIASEIVVAANLPQASEFTWFQKFSAISLSFSFISLLECVAVLYFYYKRSEDMVPWWFHKVKKWYLIREATKAGDRALQNSVALGSKAAVGAKDSLRNAGDAIKRLSILNDGDGNYDDDGEQKDDNFKNEEHDFNEIKPTELNHVTFSSSEQKHHLPENTKPENISPSSSISSLNDEAKEHLGIYDQSSPAIETSSPLMNKEEQDEPPSSTIRLQKSSLRSSRFVTTSPGEPLSEQRDRQNVPEERWDSSQGVSGNRIRMLKKGIPIVSQHQNIPSLHSNESSHSLGLSPRDADDFYNEEEVENNIYWKQCAARIDDVARFWIPFAFIVALSIVLAEVF